MEYKEIEGNLIQLAYTGMFDVITHGCNCFCTMGAGIAVDMHKHFHCNNGLKFKLEDPKHKGNVNKLGCIEGHDFTLIKPDKTSVVNIIVVNSYTQYHYGKNGYRNGRYGIPLDYDALRLCLYKINQKYHHKNIGLPTIGCSHGGGDWNKVSDIIKAELKNMNTVTVVKFNK